MLDTDSEMRFTRYFNDFEIPKEGLVFDRVFSDNSEPNSEKSKCTLKMDQIKMIYEDLRAYQENFSKRAKVLDVSKANKFMIYAEYMIVNKTEKDIKIGN